MLIFKMVSFYHFGNNLVKIALNHNKLDSFKSYIERAVEKCQRSKSSIDYESKKQKKTKRLESNNNFCKATWVMCEP